MGHDTASMYLELTAERPATTPLHRLVSEAVRKWVDEEADRYSDPRDGAPLLLAPTSREAARCAEPRDFATRENGYDEPALVVPVFSSTKKEKRTFKITVRPDRYGNYGDIPSKVHAKLSADLKTAIPHSGLKVSNLPKPEFEVEETEAKLKTRYEVRQVSYHGSISVLGHRPTKFQAIELAKELIEKNISLDGLKIEKVVLPEDGDSLIAVSRKKATDPVQVEVELVLEVPTARAKQLGWLVSFDFHS